MNAPCGFEEYKFCGMQGVLQYFSLKPSKEWGNFAAFANEYADENLSCTPGLIFHEYCRSLNSINNHSQAPTAIRDFAGELYNTIHVSWSFEQWEQCKNKKY